MITFTQKASFGSTLLIGCLLLSLAGHGLCAERRVMMLAAVHIPPYYIIDKGQYSGIIVDIQRLIAEELNWNVDFKNWAWFKLG